MIRIARRERQTETLGLNLDMLHHLLSRLLTITDGHDGVSNATNGKHQEPRVDST